ncbi:MAG: hypothetical protein JO008_20910, partial [Alphaproteobacteria bacterium]|nr:hypothetical protein [Alphaproteobacteria bacterium]
LPSAIAGTAFSYQTTSSSTNKPTGTPNTPATIAAGAAQSFVVALTPSAAVAATTVGFTFGCTGLAPAPVIPGTDTLLYSASTSPVPDIVALVATPQNDGIMHINGTTGASAIAVATSNVGSTGTITVTPNTGAAVLPLTLTVCQTNAGGQCIAPPTATVSTSIGANAIPTFGIFGAASGTIPFLPAHNRIFIQFSDSNGSVVRGSTSVAVQTQ